MGVAGQTAAATTAGLVVELKTQGEKKGKDAFDKCLAIAEQRKVGRLIVEIDGNCAVLSGRFGSLGHVSSPFGWRLEQMRYYEDNVLKLHAYCERLKEPPLNPGECDPDLNFLGVLATKYDSRTTLSENTIRAIEEQNIPLFNTKIRISVDIIRAQMERLPVNLYATDSHAAADYAALAEEILPAKVISLRSARRQISAS